jgi:hypothetical protein
VLVAVLAGAIFLDRAQRLVPVYAAARDLPAGVPLRGGDLMVVRVRLPAAALRHYLQPSPGRRLSGQVLAAPVRRERLVPAELVLASSRDGDLVELPVQADPGDMAQGLRPGDRVLLLAAYTEGASRGRVVVLLPTAEVVRVLEDPSGLAGSGQQRGVQLRMPSDRAPTVAAAIATARIFVAKAPALAGPAPPAQLTPSGAEEPPPTLGEAPSPPGSPSVGEAPPPAGAGGPPSGTYPAGAQGSAPVPSSEGPPPGGSVAR